MAGTVNTGIFIQDFIVFLKYAVENCIVTLSLDNQSRSFLNTHLKYFSNLLISLRFE